MRRRLASVFPAIEWLSTYRRSGLTSDFMAGITVTIMLIPQSLAYALLAGLPPQIGRYASILPLVAYARLRQQPHPLGWFGCHCFIDDSRGGKQSGSPGICSFQRRQG
jgi:hypothetical protein